MNSKEYEIIMESKKLLRSKNQEDINKGLEMLNHLANEKNKFAIYELATLYLEGKSVEKNIKKACNLFVFSGELGNIKAFYDAGKIFKKNRDYETAIRFFQKAKYTPNAFLEIGKMYDKGLGVSRSIRKAYEYYLEASKLGCPEADYLLSESYIYGLGVKIDFNRAKYYLNRALRKGIKDNLHLLNVINSKKVNNQ